MTKQKKIVYPVDKSAPVMFAALYLFLSSIYGSFLIMEYLYALLFSIFYAFILIPIVIFSYLTGKNIAIYCQSGKNRNKAKWIVAIIILNICFILSIHTIFNKYSGDSSLNAFANATLVSVFLFIPGLLASSRKYKVKSIKRINNSSKTKKVTKRKRNKEEFEEL